MPAPQKILDLVGKFSRNRDEYMSPSFSEASLRQEFLNPFFAAPGWDIYNSQGHAMTYREVIHEAARGSARNPGAVRHGHFIIYNLLSAASYSSQRKSGSICKSLFKEGELNDIP